MADAGTPAVIWEPQPGPQTHLISCPVFEVFFGGARGGGKTEASIGDWLEHSSRYGEAAVGVFFRRKFKQLEEVIARTSQIFPKLGAKYNKQQAEWTMANGARLKFRYIERDQDAEEYQGHSYTRIYVEELTNFPTPKPIDMLRATLRSGPGVPTAMRLTGNPGGPGHNWVKARYIDPDPRGYRVLAEEFTMPWGDTVKLERVFIPSKITDNKLLLQNDPLYVARLHQVGSAALVRSWLEGLWDIVDGAFFDEWDTTKHVLETAEWLPRIPRNAHRFRAFDWGSAKPFSCGWYAVSDGTWGLPAGAMVKYREWYGSDGPNKGIKLDAGTVAKGIKAREQGEIIRYGVADPAIFVRDGGPSIAELMTGSGVSWRRADNKRVPGWAQLHYRLRGEVPPEWEGPLELCPTKDRIPMLYFLDCCEDSIRTIPVLQHDTTKMEDVDTDGEDHAGDETRYAAMSRPWYPRGVEPVRVDLQKPLIYRTVDELVAYQRRKRLAQEQYG